MELDDEVEYQSIVSDVEVDTNSPQRNSDSKGSKQEEPSVPWSKLPFCAVERIYSFLNRKDQSSMSQVCKNWCEEYSSPNLWREITFKLPKQPLTVDMHPAVRAAQRYGHFFQHVRIVGRITSDSEDMPEVIQRQLKLFLGFLAEQSQLVSISFVTSLLRFDCKEIVQKLINLLLTQKKLLSVKFDHTLFLKNAALEILQAIFSRNSSSLKTLELVGFLEYFSDVNSADTIIDVALTFKTLMNLKVLKIAYSEFFENIITSIYEYGSGLRLQERGVLERIDLICKSTTLFHFHFHYNGIQPEAWKYLRELFPALKIFMEIQFIGYIPVDNFDVFLIRHMPVTRICLNWNANHTELVAVLQHLTDCGINENLEDLEIFGLEKTDNLVQYLLHFLRDFSKLKRLHLDIQSAVDDLNAVFEYWLENGPMSLNDVHIITRNVSDNAVISNYTNLAEIYAPLLQEVGLNLLLFADNQRSYV